MKSARILTMVAASLMHWILFGMVSAISVTAQTTGDEEDPKQLIAAQVREQGMVCDNPQSAKQEQNQSAPDEDVWTLECENATYRVKLDPDMAATIERIE